MLHEKKFNRTNESPLQKQENILIDQKIYVLRNLRVMFDADLAGLYGVSTGNLNLAVRRNLSRFPNDFMFQLTREETQNLKLQIVRSSWGGRRHAPYVFTQEGVAMLSSVLKSKRAIQMNIAIMRAFIRVREMLSTHSELLHKLETIEYQLSGHENILQNHASDIRQIIQTIRELMANPKRKKSSIGFKP